MRTRISHCLGKNKGSRGGFASAVRDLDAGLEVTVHVHETPFVFPLFVGLVVADFPGLIEGFEPISQLADDPKKKI